MIWAPLFLCILAATANPPLKTVSFSEAVQRGLRNHPDIAIAKFEVDRASGKVEEIRANALPKLTGNGNFVILDHRRALGNVLVAGKNTMYANITLTAPLVATQQWAQWRQQRTEVTTSQSRALDVRRNLSVAVARAYLGVITQKRLVEVSQHAVDTAREHFTYADTRYRGGIGTELDVLRADQELGSSQAQLYNGLAGLVQARETLGVSMGENEPYDVEAVLALPQVPKSETVDPHAEEQRADIRWIKQTQVAAQEIYDDSWRDFMPVLLGMAEPFYQNPETSSTPEWGWQVELLLNVPFYDGGARYGLRHQREAAVGVTQASVEQALRQARSEIRVAFDALVLAQDGYGVAKRASVRANETIELTVEDYKAGNTNNLQVIDAERRGRDADTMSVMAEDTVRQAKLTLLYATGAFP